MTHEEFVVLVLDGHKSVAGYVEHIDNTERDESGYLLYMPADIRERLLELLVDAMSAGDTETRMGLLQHGMLGFMRLCRDVEKRVAQLEPVSVSDRETHRREAGGHRRSLGRVPA